MALPRLALSFCIAALLMALPVEAGDNLDAYLTKDGKLAQPLETRDLQGGFAGFTGTFMKVAADGKWSTGNVFNEKLTEEKTGMLGKDEVAKLAKALAKYELLKLTTTGKVGTNPHVVTIKFGNLTATLNLGAGEMLPKVDAKAKVVPIEQRFTAIVEATRELVGK